MPKFCRCNLAVFGVILLARAMVCVGQISTTLPAPATQPGTPQEIAKAIADANALLAAKDYVKATDAARHAISLQPKPDPATLVLLGDCYLHQVLADLEFMHRAKVCFEQALAADPKNVPALRRLLDLYQQDAEVNPRGRPGEQWALVGQMATKLTVINPSDHDAWLAKHRAIVECYMRGVSISTREINDTLNGLSDLSTQGTFNPDIPYLLAQMQLFKAAQLQKTDATRGNDLIASVQKQTESAVAAYPTNAMMHYRAAQILLSISQLQHPADEQYAFPQRVQSEMTQAADLVRPDDSHYIEIKLFQARILQSSRQADKAETLYRALLTDRPGEISVRVALAELIGRDPARRAEVEQLLAEAPADDPGDSPGYKAFATRRQELLAAFDLINSKLDRLSESKSKAEFDALMEEIQGNYQRITATPGLSDSVMGLQLRGRIELVQGNSALAIQSFEQALKYLPPTAATPSERQIRDRLRYGVAGAYTIVGRDNDAINLLSPLVQDWPELTSARLLLAQALIHQHRIGEARFHVIALSKTMPDSPLILRMQIFTLDPKTDSDQIAALYAKLPESTLEEVVNKVQVAVFAGNKQDIVRLLEIAHQSFPDDMNLITNLARAYAQVGDQAKALALVDQALAANPTNADLKQLRDSIAAGK